MTAVVKLKLPTAKESLETQRRHAWAYGEMESDICNLRFMVSAVRYAWFESLENHQSSNEHADRVHGITNLLMNQLWEMTEALHRKYYAQ